MTCPVTGFLRGRHTGGWRAQCRGHRGQRPLPRREEGRGGTAYSAAARSSGSGSPSATHSLWHQCLIFAFLLDSSYPFSDYREEEERTKGKHYISKEQNQVIKGDTTVA